MQETLHELENLVQGSIQIINHFKSEYVDDGHLQQMEQMLQLEYDQITQYLNESTDHHHLQGFASRLQQTVQQVEQLLHPMEDQTRQRYEQATELPVDQFEQLAIEQQEEQEEAYHGKIDFLSIVKLQDNLHKIANESAKL